jgi:hypothetical protein
MHMLLLRMQMVGKKDGFYEACTKAYRECPRHNIKVSVGDMNAQVGRDSIRRPNIGRHGLHDDTNDDGSRLVDCALAHDLVVGGTLFIHKKIHKGTWRTPDGNTINQVDHIWIDDRHR